MTLRDDEKDASSHGPVAVQETSVLGNTTSNNDNNSSPIVINTAHDVELAEEEKDYGPPPDGGLQAWLQVLATHLINAMTWGYAASFGVYQLYYVETLGLPASQVSWIGSVQIFFTYVICAVSGRLADAGYTRETVAVGTFMAVFGTFMTSLATTYWQIFLAQGVCIGFGLGVAFMPAISVLSSYFDKNRAFALAVSAVGTSIGFPWAVRCAGFLALAMAVTANILLKPRLPPRKSGPLFEIGAFSELPYLLFSMAAFVYFYALYFVFFYINSYARNVIGFSNVDSINLLIITNAMGIPARPIVGFLADRYTGPINLFVTATFVVSIMLYSWIGVTTRTGMYVFSVVYGLSIGANQGTFVASLTSLTKDPQKMGIRFGMVETLCSLATVAGAPTAGAIIDHNNGDFFWAQIWGGTVMAAAAVIFVACRISVTGWRFKVKV
ncbi:major facilitator superfamily domain-containing protein [Trichoderma breve]|uniref:Major facilitator superfamily domain-containing protein n=1 Tax=Trichoderma breve TaxID=2034170 RepID=A0A9W9E356_9HYPO|nr:major facilitator superfamily domain-containing protein [Trichoderma breve]KAJ4856264.1 major facilitator superfamily domain-containing protein [Trichoderma breve]